MPLTDVSRIWRTGCHWSPCRQLHGKTFVNVGDLHNFKETWSTFYQLDKSTMQLIVRAIKRIREQSL